MSRASALGFVRLVDDAGREVPDALLELDVDFWNDDHTRYTVFFDPGRVKRGVRPNVELGRALRAGRRYAILSQTRLARRATANRSRPPFRHEFRRRAPGRSGARRCASWRIAAAGRRYARPARGERSPGRSTTACCSAPFGVARPRR